MIKLQFKDRRRESVWLVDQLFTIGKASTNSLMIEDPSIEAHHAEITNAGNTLSINNVNKASIKINGEELTKATQVKANDVITLGSVELELVDSQTLISNQAQKTQAAHIWSLHSSASWLEKNDFIISRKTTIGRDPQCDICLNLDHLSRKHVLLEPQNAKLFIEDLGSSNGTFVNGQRIQKTELQPGDKIKLDVLTFEVRGPSGKSASDPNKTIIRSIPSAAGQKKTPPKKAAPTIKPQQDAPRPKTVKRKKLASEGKQAWLSGDNQLKAKTEKKKNKTRLILTTCALSVVALGIVAVLLF
ncbi:MAG: FHA domain-containing protein [Oleiphilus sp.]